MSATNRGSVRMRDDFYPTPESCTLNILNSYLHSERGLPILHKISEGTAMVLEPGAGHGAIARVVKNLFPIANLTAYEIREEERVPLWGIADSVHITDFLKADIQDKYDLIIGNPPFLLAQEWIEKCLPLINDEGALLLLLRINFLESKKRHEWFQDKLPSALYALSTRPSFTGRGTDATGYAWFVWDKKPGQEIRVI